MSRFVLLVLTLAVLGSAASASAAVLATGPVTPAIGDGINCQVANLTDRTVTVNAQLRRNQTLVDSSGDFAIAPGGLLRLSVLVSIFSAHWCRFDVKGGKAAVRASVTVNPGGINGGRDVLVMPAQ